MTDHDRHAAGRGLTRRAMGAAALAVGLPMPALAQRAAEGARRPAASHAALSRGVNGLGDRLLTSLALTPRVPAYLLSPYNLHATLGMLALGARAVMATGSPRALDNLLRDRDRPGLVAALEVPRPRDPRTLGFVKVQRVKPRGVSILSIAVHLPREGGRLRGVRVAFGAMGPAPLRVSGVERALEGATLDATTIARAVAAAAEGLTPPTDPVATGWYRAAVVGVHLKRLLERMV